MNRKTLIIALVVIILLGIGGYFYFSTKTPTSPTTPSISFPGGSRPATGFIGTGTGSNGEEGTTFTPGSSAPLPRLYELHKLPVAGVGFIEAGKGLDHTVSARYVERGLGHIYEASLSTLMESRIVNETRSRIMEALWGNGGKSVVIRFIDEKEGGAIIKTSILNLGGITISFARSTSTAPVSDFIKTEEVFLPDYIPFLATAEDGGDKLFYLESGLGASVGSLATFKDLGVSTIFNSAFTEWLPQFPNLGLVTLTSKPSASVLGYLFFIDTKTKSATKVLSGINGLTTLTSHDGKFVLFSETKNGVPELSVYDTVKKVGRPLLMQTLPEKCVWGFKNATIAYCAVPQTIPEASYPDQWYQGLVTFSDAVWEIDTTTGLTQKIMAPSNLGASALDMINLALSSNDAYLLFMNKVTGTPWVYSIIEPPAPMKTVISPPVSTTTRAVIAPIVSTTTKLVVPPSVVTSDMQKLK